MKISHTEDHVPLSETEILDLRAQISRRELEKISLSLKIYINRKQELNINEIKSLYSKLKYIRNILS